MARPTVVRVIAMTDTDALLAEIAGLQRQVADLKQQVVQLTTVEPNSAEDRFGVALNPTYTAPVTGYLSVSSTDGRTGRAELLVGYEDPRRRGFPAGRPRQTACVPLRLHTILLTNPVA
jgi:hypothetical protein